MIVMTSLPAVARILCLAATIPMLVGPVWSASQISWKRLPPLPNAEGFAAMYAGVAGGTLIAAGGTQFRDGIPWWDGGKKIWSDAIYLLEPDATTWRVATEKLPRALGDGVGLTHADRLVCIGGGDENHAFADVFALQVRAGRLVRTALAPLPEPTLKMSGAVIGNLAFIIGGRNGPNSLIAKRTLHVLDLSRAGANWMTLSDCPGPGRMMPIVAAAGGALYVFGGIAIQADNGTAKNVSPYLRDAWRYRPAAHESRGTWDRLADLPHPIAASPSPAWAVDADTILIFGGVDGAIESIADRSSIRKLPGQIIAYSIRADRWTLEAEMPLDEIRVNAPAVSWRGGYAIISGEHLPARRTNACTLITVP
jgi:N-acetylneuraminic acid mutarotase